MNSVTNSLPGPRPAFAHLPDDVICELFEALADIDPAHRTTLGWIKLTHVCRRLRNIGNAYLPKLWAQSLCVFPTLHAWETMLARSRNAPLILDIRDCRFRSILPCPIPSYLLSRAVSIADTIHWDHPTGRKWWSEATLPHLKAIKLDVWTGWDYLRNPRLLPASEGHISAPRLVRYQSHDIFIPFHAPSLRELCVYVPVAWTTLLDSLRTCHLLEDLTLLDTREPPSPVPVTVHQVALPRLHFFSLLKSSDASICKFIDSLDFPLGTLIFVRNCPSTTVFRQLLGIRQLIRRSQLDTGDALGISAKRSIVDGTRTLSFDVTGHWLSLKYFNFELQFRGSYMSGTDVELSIREEPEVAASRLVDMLEEAFSPSSALDIRVLAFMDDLDSPGPLPYSWDGMKRLGDALRAFAGVKMLYVRRQTLLLLKLLRDSLEESADTGTMSVNDALFPELDTLVVDMKTARMNESEWSTVVGILAYRKAGGRPLARLVLMGTHLCHLSPDRDPGVTKLRVDLRPVRKLAGEVIDLRGKGGEGKGGKKGKRCTCDKYC